MEKSRIAESGDYNLSGDRYITSTTAVSTEYDMVELGDICEINPKKSELKNFNDNLEVSFVPMANLGEKTQYFNPIEKRKL